MNYDYLVSPATDRSPRGILHWARYLVSGAIWEFNWGQGDWIKRSDGIGYEVCLLGAIDVALLGASVTDEGTPFICYETTDNKTDELWEEIYPPLMDALAETSGERQSLMLWNDRPERNKREVLKLLDAAIEKIPVP